jgi:hypothetical protein
MRISGECLFWLLASVVLSVILTVLANLFLSTALVLGGVRVGS